MRLKRAEGLPKSGCHGPQSETVERVTEVGAFVFPMFGPQDARSRAGWMS